MKKLLTLAFVSACFAAQAQVLDSSFDHIGYSIGAVASPANRISQLSDGSFVIGVNNSMNPALCKVTASGNADSSYGTAGVSQLIVGTCLTYGSSANVITDIAIQSDDMAIGIGYGEYPYGGLCGYQNMFMFRMKNNGAPDSSSGACGMIHAGQILGSYPVNLTYSHLTRIKMLPDGKFIVLGFGQVSGVFDIYTLIMRFNSDGTLDNTFGVNGICTTNSFLNDMGNYWDMIVDASGNIVVLGTSTPPTSGAELFPQAIRITSAGVVDSTFGVYGVVAMPSGSFNTATAIQQRADGKYVIIGSDGISSNLIVLNTNGSVNSTIVPGGFDTINVPGYSVNTITSFYIQPDNKLVVTGYGMNDYYACAYIGRLNEDGTYDATFNGIGVDTFNFGAHSTWEAGTFLYQINNVCGNRALACGAINLSSSTTAQSMFIVRMRMDEISTCTYHPLSTPSLSSLTGTPTVYPNPAYDEINIENAQPNSTYRILNNLGQTVKSGTTVSSTEAVNINGLSTGNYILQLSGTDGVRNTWKITKL